LLPGGAAEIIEPAQSDKSDKPPKYFYVLMARRDRAQAIAEGGRCSVARRQRSRAASGEAPATIQ
jgi:hypothetical protein